MYISSAVSTRTTFNDLGGGVDVGPHTTVTSAPRRRACVASAKPIRPVDRLEMYLTGSIASRVGPAVTRTRTPARSFGRERRRHRFDDRGRVGEPSDPEIAGRKVPFLRIDQDGAVGGDLRDVALHARVLPHLGVHGRSDDHRAPAHQVGGAHEVVPAPGREPRQARRCRADDHVGVRPPCELDVDDALGLVEEVDVHRRTRQSGQRSRADEIGRRGRS